MSLKELYYEGLDDTLLENVLRVYERMKEGTEAQDENDLLEGASKNGKELIERLNSMPSTIGFVPCFEIYVVISTAAQNEINKRQSSFNNVASIFFAAISIVLGLTVFFGEGMKWLFLLLAVILLVSQGANVIHFHFENKYIIKPLTTAISWLRSAEIESRVDSLPIEITEAIVNKITSDFMIMESGLVSDGDEFSAKIPHKEERVRVRVRLGAGESFELENCETGDRYSSFDQAYKNAVSPTSTNAFITWFRGDETLHGIRCRYLVAGGFLNQRDIDAYNRAKKIK